MTTTITDQASWESAHQQLTPAARERFQIEEMRTIRKTVAPDLDPAEFQMFLAMAAKYDLDPLAKEIWGTKGKAKDGRPGRVMILVGRDGLLKVARRDKTYKGFDTDVVHKADTFQVRRSAAGREIIHEYEGWDERGDIVGAWAQVYAIGYHDAYFFAPFEEYKPQRADSYSPWLKQPSVMIQKCALSLCLRLAYNLSGVLGEEEADRMLEVPSAPAESETLEELAQAFPEELRERFYSAYSEAQQVRPGMLAAAAVQMQLDSVEPDGLERWLADVESDNERAAEEARNRAAQVAAEEAPVDAEVVAEPGTRLAQLYEDANDPTLSEQQRLDIDAEIEALEASR